MRVFVVSFCFLIFLTGLTINPLTWPSAASSNKLAPQLFTGSELLSTSPTPGPTPAPKGWRVVRADQFSGDLAARINAADASLGETPGEIIVTGNDPITSVVTISSKHVLNISGTHVLKKGIQHLGLIRLKDGSRLTGNGILQNDVTGMARPRMIETWEGTQPLADSKYPATHDARIARNITIENIQLRDVPGANPTAQINAAVMLGNCQDCKVSRVWFNGLNDFGVQVGGHALWPKLWADGVEITDCLFTEVAAQNVAVVHGQNVVVARNRFIKPGRVNQAISIIDVEANYSTYSRLMKITIVDNFIDARETPGSFSGISITSSAPWVPTEDIVISRNQLLGDNAIPGAHSRKGIELAGDDLNSPDGKRILVSENKISGFKQICIVAAGDNVRVIGNTLTNCGVGAPLAGILVSDLRNSLIKDNTIFGNVAQINLRGKNVNNLIEGNKLAQIQGISTNSIFRNNLVSNEQNTGGGIYHSGVKESPGSFGNLYEGNRITRSDGGNAFGLQIQPGSVVRSTIWLEPKQ